MTTRFSGRFFVCNSHIRNSHSGTARNGTGHPHQGIWHGLFLVTLLLLCAATPGVYAETGAGTGAAGRIAPPLTDLIERFAPAKGASAEVLHKRVISKLSPDLLATSTTYVAVRIQDDEAIQDYSQIHLTYNDHFSTLALDFARVRDPSGNLQTVAPDAIQIQTPQQSDFYQDRKELVFSLPSLRPGSVIEFQYQITDTRAVIPQQWFDRFHFYWWESKANFQGRLDPVRESHVEIQAPATVALNFGKGPFARQVTKETSDSGTTYRINRQNLPAIKLEAAVPPEFFRDYYLEVTTLENWDQVRQWAKGLFEPKINLNADIKEVVVDISRQNSTTSERIRAVYEYLQNNVRYVFAHVGRGGYEPHTSSEVIENAYGDCKDQTILALTLLRALGIDAHAALVSTSDGSNINDDLPYVAFNHMITYIPAQANQPEMWLDTSGSKALFPGFHSSLDNRPALIIDDRTENRLSTIAPRPYTAHGADLYLKITADGNKDSRVDFSIRPRGSFEDHYRSWWTYAPEREKALRQMALGIYTTAKFISADVKHATDLWKPIQVEGALKLEDVWKGEPEPFSAAIGINQLLRMFASISSLDTPDNRINPMHIARGYQLKLIADIESPRPDYAPYAASAGPSQNTAFFRLRQSSRKTENGYRVEIIFDLPDQLISQQDYKTFYDAIMGIEKLSPWYVNFSRDPDAGNVASEATLADDATPTQRIARLQSWLDSGEFDKALQEAQALVEAYPDNGEAYYFLGLAQGYRGQFDSSNRSFAKAVELGYEL